MISQIRFYMLPGELRHGINHIAVRDFNRHRVGTIVRDRSNTDKTKNTLVFQSLSGRSLSSNAMRKIYELMESIESGYTELTEQLIEESQVKTKVDSNVVSAV